MSESRHDVTRLLDAIGHGDSGAASDLLPVVYDELRRLAAAHLGKESPGQTLQATALVHEAYLRLVGDAEVLWQNRGHFFAAAARAMRRILVERARRYATVKHGGAHGRTPYSDSRLLIAEQTPTPENPPVDLIALHDALTRLETHDARQADIVMMRYFAGLTIDETAAAMALSPATVKNEWLYAKAWLRRELDRLDETGT